MRIYLFPYYVTLHSVLGSSPHLKAILSNFDLQLVACAWEGTIDSLPSEPSIVRASTEMDCSWVELGKKCAEIGHLCLYRDNVVGEDGVLSNRDFATKVEEFLLLHGVRPTMSNQRTGEEIDLSPPFDKNLIDVGGI